jgi:pimeloyl-ACP methyl ester carboxylesterase
LGQTAAALLGPWIIPPALHLIYHRRELITPEVVAGYALPFREIARRQALGHLCRQLEIWPLDRVEWLLQKIRQPVTLVWGECDRILPVAQAHWIKARLPRAGFHLLPQVGHAPQEEAPAVVNKIIIDFLTRSLNN